MQTATGKSLTADEQRQIAAAGDRARKIRRAANVAAFNGWSMGVCAVVSTLFAPFSLVGFLVAAALWVVTVIEFRGRRRLLKFDPLACRMLGWNQVGLLAVIVVYCAWNIVWVIWNPDKLLSTALPPELQSQIDLDQIQQLAYGLYLVIYGTVIVATLLVQGGNALYYFTRERIVRSYLAETEPWIVQMQQSISA